MLSKKMLTKEAYIEEETFGRYVALPPINIQKKAFSLYYSFHLETTLKYLTSTIKGIKKRLYFLVAAISFQISF